MASKQLTDKLLDGYEVKQPAKTPAQTPLAEGESYTISDKPQAIVCKFFNSLQFFEDNKPAIAGKTYIFVATLLFTVIFWMKQAFLPTLPPIEVIFVAFLTTFIFNYYLINGALYKPFIEDEDHSYLIKVCGAFAVGTIASFFYALKFVELQTALTIFYTAFFLVIVIQTLFLRESYKTNELLLALGALIGTAITISGSSGSIWNGITPTEPNFLYGFGLSAASAVFMALIMINFGKMNTENFATMNHIFTMMVVLFVPIFFPIQGVVTPTLEQWVILVLIGIMTALGSLAFIRSFQIETGGRSAVFLFLQVAFVFIIEFVVSGASGAMGLVGAAITIGCVGMYSQQSESKIPIRGSFAAKEDDKLHEMAVLSRSDE